MPEHRIQILKLGKWGCSAGIVEIDDQVAQDVIETYNPSFYKAPLTISHDLPRGVTENSLPYAADLAEGDRTVSVNGLAYGAPTRLERRPDGGVDAIFDRISPCFLSFVKNKNLLSISPGLYRPSDFNNPYRGQGKWALKHVAGLGEPPAQKGMDDLATSLGLEGAVPVMLSGKGGINVYHTVAPSLADALAYERARRLWV